MKKIFLIIFGILILASSLSAYEILKKDKFDKEEFKEHVKEQYDLNREPISTDYDFSKHIMDSGCLSVMANVKDLNNKRINALYYSVVHEIWEKQHVQQGEPTLSSINESLKRLCNQSISQNKSFEFILYTKAMAHKMSHERYFEISNYIHNYNFEK